MTKLIIYLHGFNSGPDSLKANQLKTYLSEIEGSYDSWFPQLPLEPDLAISKCEKLIVEQIKTREICVIGSSLGGFYAIYLANKYNLKCVAINPALHPDQYISSYRDVLNAMNQDFDELWLNSYIKIINSLKVRSISKPEHFMLLAQKGDELIDYKIAQHYFSQAIQDIEDNGNHNFDGFERKLPKVFEFLG